MDSSPSILLPSSPVLLVFGSVASRRGGVAKRIQGEAPAGAEYGITRVRVSLPLGNRIESSGKTLGRLRCPGHWCR